MTSAFGNVAFFVAIGSGAWGMIFVVALLLCCGMMMFGMGRMGKRSNRPDKSKEEPDKDDDDRRNSTK